MYYLQVKNLHKSFGIKPLLQGVDFCITKGQKIALVAKNGSGKSTLFELLQGAVQCDDGDIEFNRSISIAFLSQQFEGDKKMLVSDYIGSYDNSTQEEWEHTVKIQKMINVLNLKDLLDKQLSVCSGGELKRIQLAKTLKDEPQFLLLDEPTNHLDLEMINRLENYLSRSHITLFMITHDRYFLDRICTDIRELDRGKLHQYTGNYKDFLYKKSQREEREALQVHKLKQLYTAELEWIRRAPSGRQTKKVDRIAGFHAIKDRYHDQKSAVATKNKKIELQTINQRLGNKVIKIHKLSKSFGERVIISNFTYNLIAGEHIGVLGKNGVGKSTLMNIIAGIEDYNSGDIQWGSNISVGYFRQSVDRVDNDMSILEYIKQYGDIMVVGTKRITASQLLENFLFDPKQQQAKLFTVSGGERKRLQLCVTLIKNPNVLILDEPTNDLDIETMTVLEEFLTRFTGSILIISHDRYFLDKLVDHLFVFEDNGIIGDYWGNYTTYTQASKEERKKLKNTTTADKEEYENKDKDSGITNNEELPPSHPLTKKLSYHEQREFTQLGEEMVQIDQRKEEINRIFQQEDLSTDQIITLSKELSDLVKQSEQKEARWFELAERS